MKFLCDQMLIRLGRWLRAAGYDTVVIEKSFSDQEILQRALKEKRYLITRDRHFLEMPAAKEWLLWLKANSVEECAEELSKKIAIDWLHHPFTRCLLCNRCLEKMEEAPEGAPTFYDEFWRCSHCDKVYWLGSHTKHMLQTLTRWNQHK